MKDKEAKYIGESNEFYTNGKLYILQYDGDGYNEPFIIFTKDDMGNSHIVAYYSTEDEWFKEHFEVVKEDVD